MSFFRVCQTKKNDVPDEALYFMKTEYHPKKKKKIGLNEMIQHIEGMDIGDQKHTEYIFSVTAFLNDFLSPWANRKFIWRKRKNKIAIQEKSQICCIKARNSNKHKLD